MTQPSPLVSVVIPCHNSGWSIGRTLASVSAQRYPHVEIVVVNDGSTDDSMAVIADHQRRDKRIRVIEQEQRGLAGARNRGIAETSGPYVAPVDADDLWHPDYLVKQVAALQRTDAPFSYAYSLRIDANDYLLHTKPRPTVNFTDFDRFLLGNMVGNGSASVIRRDRLIDIGGYDETLRQRNAEGAEDWKVSLLLTAQAPAAVVPERLVGYRIYASSMSRRDPERQLRAALAVLGDVYQAVPEVTRQRFLRARTRSIAWQLPGCLGPSSTGTVMKLLSLAYLRNPLWFVDGAAVKLLPKVVLDAFVNGSPDDAWHAGYDTPVHVSDAMFAGMDLGVEQWKKPQKREDAA